MSVAFKKIAEVAEQISQIEQKHQATSKHLEQIAKLEKTIKDDHKSAEIADKITQIQLIVDEANNLAESKKFYLLLKKVDEAICSIQSFHERHQKPLPDKIFDDLCKNLEAHRASINKLEESIKQLIALPKKGSTLGKIDCMIQEFKNLSKALEGNLEFFPYHLLCGLEECMEKMISEDTLPDSQKLIKQRGDGFGAITKEKRKDFAKVISSSIELIRQAKTFVLSTQSAEAKAVQRIQDEIPTDEYITVGELGSRIDLTKLNERLKKRGYNIQISGEDTPTG